MPPTRPNVWSCASLHNSDPSRTAGTEVHSYEGKPMPHTRPDGWSCASAQLLRSSVPSRTAGTEVHSNEGKAPGLSNEHSSKFWDSSSRLSYHQGICRKAEGGQRQIHTVGDIRPVRRSAPRRSKEGSRQIYNVLPSPPFWPWHGTRPILCRAFAKGCHQCGSHARSTHWAVFMWSLPNWLFGGGGSWWGRPQGLAWPGKWILCWGSQLAKSPLLKAEWDMRSIAVQLWTWEYLQDVWQLLQLPLIDAVNTIARLDDWNTIAWSVPTWRLSLYSPPSHISQWPDNYPKDFFHCHSIPFVKCIPSIPSLEVEEPASTQPRTS